jgi:hypothetical protein
MSWGQSDPSQSKDSKQCYENKQKAGIYEQRNEQNITQDKIILYFPQIVRQIIC